MGFIRRGGYQIVFWIGDHLPKHVHVYKDGKLILKWDVKKEEPMGGKTASRRLTKILKKLKREGLI